MENLKILDEYQEPGSLELAPIGARFGALVIDLIVLLVVQFLIFVPVYGLEGLAEPNPDSDITIDLLSIAIGILYFGLQEGNVGATLGKRAVGIKVVSDSGEPMDMGKGFLRAFMRIISGLILAIGYILAFFNKENKTFHDTVAKTLVVRA